MKRGLLHAGSIDLSESEVEIGRYFARMKAIGNPHADGRRSNFYFEVANFKIPVFKNLNKNERRTVLRKGHVESLQAL